MTPWVAGWDLVLSSDLNLCVINGPSYPPMISMGGWVGFGPMVKPIWNTQIHLKHPNAMPVASFTKKVTNDIDATNYNKTRRTTMASLKPPTKRILATTQRIIEDPQFAHNTGFNDDPYIHQFQRLAYQNLFPFPPTDTQCWIQAIRLVCPNTLDPYFETNFSPADEVRPVHFDAYGPTTGQILSKPYVSVTIYYLVSCCDPVRPRDGSNQFSRIR